MTNPANVTVITDKLISYLTNTKDEFMKADLVSKITQLAERYPHYTTVDQSHLNIIHCRPVLHDVGISNEVDEILATHEVKYQLTVIINFTLLFVGTKYSVI